MTANKGFIYILTNPSFPDYVKIGFAHDVQRRVDQLNRTECTPFAFRIYAQYEVHHNLVDKQLHKLIDGLNGDLMWGLKSGPLGLLKKDENAQRVVS